MDSQEAMGVSEATLQGAGARESAWGGGVAPYAIGSKKLGMWLFIISDALTFTALLVAYSYSRLTNPNWSTPFPIWPAIALSSMKVLRSGRRTAAVFAYMILSFKSLFVRRNDFDDVAIGSGSRIRVSKNHTRNHGARNLSIGSRINGVSKSDCSVRHH